MLVLGIESSCDETAAAVVENGRRVLSDVIATQIEDHSRFGGVVPEIASRKHVESILPVIGQALSDAGLTMGAVDAIAVTQGPGLVGALLVGISAAKAMAYALEKPLIGVNHLEAHIQAAFLSEEPPAGPFICLVVSGGHTALYRVEPDGYPSLLGSTRDDAAGEAFDKIGKLLGLKYPGGISIDRVSATGNPSAVQFPRALPDKESLEFSFSGLKTAVANFLRGRGGIKEAFKDGLKLEDLTASFQEAIVDVLVTKSLTAARMQGLSDLAAVGGVAANRRLRERLLDAGHSEGVRIHLPPLRYCTDNAVMVAAAGYSRWRRSGFCLEPLDLDAISRWM